MRASRRTVVVALVAIGVLAVPLLASAGSSSGPSKVDRATATFDFTDNMDPIGYSARKVPLDNFRPRQGVFNSDRASLIFRSWNSPTPAPRGGFNSPTQPEIPVTDPLRFTQPGAFCGDWPMFREPAAPPLPERGQEGVHIIDVSDPEEPEVIGFVDTPCGSHTETLVPDLRNDRLLIYSNSSANTTFGDPAPGEIPPNCRGIDIIEVPLDDPAAASYLRFEPAGDPDEDITHRHSCHDTGVVL